jgi:heme oxygenase
MLPDLSQPISSLLAESIGHVHKAAQASPGLGWLIRGELDKDEYVRYLMMLWHIYE